MLFSLRQRNGSRIWTYLINNNIEKHSASLAFVINLHLYNIYCSVRSMCRKIMVAHASLCILVGRESTLPLLAGAPFALADGVVTVCGMDGFWCASEAVDVVVVALAFDVPATVVVATAADSVGAASVVFAVVSVICGSGNLRINSPSSMSTRCRWNIELGSSFGFSGSFFTCDLTFSETVRRTRRKKKCMMVKYDRTSQ